MEGGKLFFPIWERLVWLSPRSNSLSSYVLDVPGSSSSIHLGVPGSMGYAIGTFKAKLAPGAPAFRQDFNGQEPKMKVSLLGVNQPHRPRCFVLRGAKTACNDGKRWQIPTDVPMARGKSLLLGDSATILK